MKYEALLDLRLQHPFYTDGRCPDFAIEPSGNTARLLLNHRCVMRASPDGIRILTAIDAATDLPFLPLPQTSSLHFHLTLRNDNFVYITDLAALEALSSPLFTNAGLAAGVSELALVPDGAALALGAFANIEFQVAALGPGIASYHIAFKAKERRWAYYCITDLAPNGDDIAVVDASPSGTPDVIVFSDANRTDLDQAPDPTDSLGSQLASRYPGMRCVRMVSDEAIACRQAPREHLELRRGVDSLASSLPNPSSSSVSRIGTPQEDVLYQVVKYHVNPFENP